MTKQEREQEQKAFKEILKSYIEDGIEITIIHKTRCQLIILVPCTNEIVGSTTTKHIWNITRIVAKALGYTHNTKNDTLIMPGYGYSRAAQIIADIESVLGVKNISKNEIYL